MMALRSSACFAQKGFRSKKKTETDRKDVSPLVILKGDHVFKGRYTKGYLFSKNIKDKKSQLGEEPPR